MSTISLVQGASRGIGLQFCRSLLSRNQQAIVIATCRSPEKADGLSELRKENPERLHVHKLDVTETGTDIENVSKHISESFGRIDLLINSAGMLHPSGRGETSLKDVTDQVKIYVFRIFSLCLFNHGGVILSPWLN
jgi:NAD(P)-dependent dehydrogenase (short-subunit alcohol dehydrogenase family)